MDLKELFDKALFQKWFEKNKDRLDGTTVSEPKYSIEDLQFVFEQALKVAKEEKI